MEVVKPTKKQVWDELRQNRGCCWLGGSGCHCYSRSLSQCFAEEEKRLAKTIYTKEEINQQIENNRKAMKEIDKALNFLNGEDF